MTAFASRLAAHPIEVFLIAAATLLVAIALSAWLLRGLREPLWRALHRSGAAPWVRRLPPLRGIERPDEALGGLVLDLGFGFLLVVGALAAFFALADAISLGDGLAQFDHALATSMAQGVPDPILRAFAYLTRMADMEAQTAICIAVAMFLLWRRQRLLALIWVAAVAGNGALTRVMKWTFARERPLHDHGWVVEHGWSFPSGHASGALAVYGMLAYLLLRATPRIWHLPIVLTTSVLVLAIGYSRVLLHVHYFSDVLAGWTVAGAWLVVCIATARLIRAHRNPVRA